MFKKKLNNTFVNTTNAIEKLNYLTSNGLSTKFTINLSEVKEADPLPKYNTNWDDTPKQNDIMVFSKTNPGIADVGYASNIKKTDIQNQWINCSFVLIDRTGPYPILDRFHYNDLGDIDIFIKLLKFNYGSLNLGKYFGGVIGFSHIYCNMDDSKFAGWQSNNGWTADQWIIKEGIVIQEIHDDALSIKLKSLFKVLNTPPISFIGEKTLVKSIATSFNQQVIITLETEFFEGKDIVSQSTTDSSTSLSVGSSISGSVYGISVSADVSVSQTWGQQYSNGTTLSTHIIGRDSVTFTIDALANKTYNIYCLTLSNDTTMIKTSIYSIEEG
jgi:hypothetical protein